MSRPLLLMTLLTLFSQLSACATNPVTGRRELVLVSESQEIAMGQSYAPQIATSMGIYDDPDLQAYVESIALPMAAASERPALPWQFRVIDDPNVNAFAVPGGFIYVTRGILAHMGSEAELASVLGHEIGHVTARHSVNQLSKQQLASLGLGIGAVALGDRAADLLPMASTGLQMLFLSYGRGHERQSDDLGLRYMTQAGYQPDEMVSMFRTLGRTSQAAGGGRVPEWMSTHPSPENRERRIAEAIAELRASTNVDASTVNRDPFMQMIDGMVYGPNPRAGFFSGTTFHHPELRFRIRFPEGWTTSNQTQAVAALSPERDAILQLSMAQGASAEEAGRAFFSQQGLQSRRVGATNVNGQRGYIGSFGVTTQQGPIEGMALFVEHREAVYQVLGYGPQERFYNHASKVSAAISSFDDERDPKILGARPWRINIVRPARSLSADEFKRSYPGPVSANELALINELDAGERYPAGEPAKRIVGKALPGVAAR